MGRSQPEFQRFQRLVNQLLSSLGDALAAAKRGMISLPLEDPGSIPGRYRNSENMSPFAGEKNIQIGYGFMVGYVKPVVNMDELYFSTNRTTEYH